MTQKKIVYVLNKHGEPLMPTTRCGHVRKLLKEGKAVAINNCPFTIRLKYDVDDIRQNVYYGIDTGRENIGAGASDEGGNCLHMSQLKTNNKTIKKSMYNRLMHRKERRQNKRIKKQRKAMRNNTSIANGQNDIARTNINCKSKEIRYPGAEKSVTHKIIQGAEAQFNNRACADGWLTPSGRQLIQMHILMLDNARKFLPITHICLERVCFDFQKLENANIEAWEYSQGPLYGFKNYKDYVDARQEGKCLICGKKHIDEHHHIVPRSQGGTDRVANIAGLCEECHRSIDGVHKNENVQSKLLNLVGEQCQFHSISLLNSVMPTLIKAIQKYCDEHLLTLSITGGHQTAKIRKVLGLDAHKTDQDGGHHIDAYCISLFGRELPNMNNVSFPDVLYNQQRFKKKSSNNINKLNRREYYCDGKLVAVNRHKSVKQEDDSLEEYIAKYRETHTPLECARHMHNLMVKPAKRTYTYHKYGKNIRIHAGDKVRYQKESNTDCIVMVFVAKKIEVNKDDIDKTKVRHDGAKCKRLQYCRVVDVGCLPFVFTIKLKLIDNTRNT